MDKFKKKGYKNEYYFSNKPEINLPDTPRAWFYHIDHSLSDDRLMSAFKKNIRIMFELSDGYRKANERMNEKFVKVWQERHKKLEKK